MDIEKDIAKVEKEVKKEGKKIVLIGILIAIVVATVLFITGIRVQIAVADNLAIMLEPSLASYVMYNSENQTIDFNVLVTDSIFCTANCSYAFYDRSEQSMLDNGSLLMKDKMTLQRSYILMPYRKGSGQKIYNFDMQCTNIKSFLCTTNSLPRRRTSFITLNYQLTAAELAIQQSMGPLIKERFIELNNASVNAMKVQFILNYTPSLIGSLSLAQRYAELNKTVSLALLQANVTRILWANEEYPALEGYYAESRVCKAADIRAEAEVLLNTTLRARDDQEILLIEFNRLRSSFLTAIDSQERYAQFLPGDSTLRVRFDAVYSLMRSASQALSSKTYPAVSSFRQDISAMSVLLAQFNASLTENYHNIMSAGRNLSILEFSKKCLFVPCANITGNVCSDLAAIQNEYALTSYPAPENFTSDKDYFSVDGGRVSISLSNDSRLFLASYCSPVQNATVFPRDIPVVPVIGDLDIGNFTPAEPLQDELSANYDKCCVYGNCGPCCTDTQCRDDPALFPVVLIHGHSLLKQVSPDPLLDGFNKIQYQLQDDGYINAGMVQFDFNSSELTSDWGRSSHPVAVKASYYYDSVHTLGRYIQITRSTDDINDYAIRLNDIINLVKFKTGRPKVNVISHSMGGLVVRRYIQLFGEESVNKVILIATANNGIEGATRQFCDIFGEKRECEDMAAGSILLSKLNDQNYMPGKVRFYTISGKGCPTGSDDGDGVIGLNSSLLPYAPSAIVNGTCSDPLKNSLHNDLLDIDKYPVVYSAIRDILKEG